MANKKKQPEQPEDDNPFIVSTEENHIKRCPECGSRMISGEFSSMANFGVTREPHFVTGFGFMQVRYERATPVDCYMCIKCGLIKFYGRLPLAAMDPIERQKAIKEFFPELAGKLEKIEKQQKERKAFESVPSEDDDEKHRGV